MKMKNLKYWLLAVPIAAAMLVSCEADIIETGNKVDQNGYEAVNENNVYLRDAKTFSTSAIAEFFAGQTEKTTSVQAGLQQAAATTVSGTVSIDEAWLETYNAQNDTSYELLPTDRVTIAEGGAFTIAAGSLNASPVGITLNAPAEIDATGTFYALPLAVNVSTGASTSEADSHVVYLVRDQRVLGDCIKLDAEGNRLPQSIVMFDAGRNPLNALTFELENGKMLWDIVVLFASNLEWNSDEGRPYLSHNPELQWAYDNRESVIVPLQKRGIKVFLSILNGNGSIAGVAQLSELGVKTFAAEVARFVYANDIDGILLDNEYEGNPNLDFPYLAPESAFNCARLYHELKTLMPDKLMMSYEYSLTAVGGMQNAYKAQTGVDVSEYIDIICADYGGRGYPPAGSGLTVADATGFSIELSPERGSNSFSTATGQSILSGGYGYWMAFNLEAQYYFNTDKVSSGRGQLVSRLTHNAGIEALYGSDYKDPEVFYNRMDLTPRPISTLATDYK